MTKGRNSTIPQSHESGFTRGDGLLEGFLAKKRAAKANEFITSKMREGKILDIGCGTYPYFLVSTTFSDKYGIDPSLNTSQDKLLDIHLSKLSLSKEKLPFKDNFFNCIVMLAVFEHIENEVLPYLLADIKRILRKDGVFIITTPAPWSDKLLHLIARSGLISSEEIHDHKHNHPKSKIEALLATAGFAKKNIQSGFFELGFNMWFVSRK